MQKTHCYAAVAYYQSLALLKLSRNEPPILRQAEGEWRVPQQNTTQLFQGRSLIFDSSVAFYSYAPLSDENNDID